MATVDLHRLVSTVLLYAVALTVMLWLLDPAALAAGTQLLTRGVEAFWLFIVNGTVELYRVTAQTL